VILAADVTLPDNAGYVVAAYLVFLLLLLIYVAIMATKLSRFERELTELNELAEMQDEETPDRGPASGAHRPTASPSVPSASGTPPRTAA
jgi:hypothetical protein